MPSGGGASLAGSSGVTSMATSLCPGLGLKADWPRISVTWVSWVEKAPTWEPLPVSFAWNRPWLGVLLPEASSGGGAGVEVAGPAEGEAAAVGQPATGQVHGPGRGADVARLHRLRLRQHVVEQRPGAGEAGQGRRAHRLAVGRPVGGVGAGEQVAGGPGQALGVDAVGVGLVGGEQPHGLLAE